MAAYQLEATEGGQTYCIPQGETMIGRGPFLGISDKKVSRNHAILEVVDDKLRIKPIHVNPCFYRASHKGTFAPLEKDKWCWLHDGDCISLLPDKLSFRVIAHLLQEATLRNSQALDEGCALNNGSPHMTTDNGGQIEVEEPSCLHKDNVKPVLSPPSTKCDEKKVENGSDLSNVVGCKVDAEQSKPPQRKRTLPKWMLQGDLVVQSLPTPVVKAGKKRRNVRTDETEINVENVTKNKQSRAVKSKDNGERGPIKKSKAAAPTEDLPGPSSDTLQARVEHKYSPKPVIDNEEEEMEAECYDLSPCPSPKPESSSNGNATIKQHQSSNSQVISQSAKSPQTAQQVPKRRTPCMYAERCYRKNPVHFQEFSHPGDSDYHDVESGSQDDNDDRPECPYGTDCYRKNPQHKLEYKHTKPPGRRLRKRPAKKAKSALDDDSDNDGPNEYDLEDSFIDDDDEEEEDITDEDSDWMPDSEEKDSEDVKQLLKEAKGFVKRKH